MSDVPFHEDIIPIRLPTPFIVGPVNAFLVKGPPLTLVDTGPQTDEAYAMLSAKMAEHGYAVRDLEAILLTHAHVDHVGLAKRLVDESGAETYAHNTTADQVEDFRAFEIGFQEFIFNALRAFGTPDDIIESTAQTRDDFTGMGSTIHIDHRLSDGDAVLQYTAYYTPGHSSMDTLFVDAERKFAFTGDHVLTRITPSAMMRRPRPGETRAKSLVDYQNSLRRTLEFDLELLYPGHGDPITKPREAIGTLLERQERRTRKIKTIVEAQNVTPHELCNVLFPDIAPQYYYLGMSVAIGHLEVLEDRGEIVGEMCNGVRTYVAASPANR